MLHFGNFYGVQENEILRSCYRGAIRVIFLTFQSGLYDWMSSVARSFITRFDKLDRHYFDYKLNFTQIVINALFPSHIYIVSVVRIGFFKYFPIVTR